MADEDLQSVSSDESRPQSRLKQRPQAHPQRSNISTASAQDSVDGFGAHQIWYPPPPAYEEEDHSQVRPPHLPLSSLAAGLYPNTRSPDEWRQYPDFPAAYPLSPVQDSMPPPGFRIVAPVPKRPSDVIDIDNMSNSGQSDGSEPADNEVRPGFRQSLLSSREFVNPNSVVRLSDEYPTHGVQSEKTKSNRKKRKRLSLEDREKGGPEEDEMDVDEEVGGDIVSANEDMDEDGSEDEGYARDETFTTPRIRTVPVDSDAEMGDASGSERENSFSLQTPLPPRRNGKRTRSNITLKRPSSVATLNPRSNVQDARFKIKVYPASPVRPVPRHLAPPMSASQSGSSVWSASTTLSTLGGGDSLMTGDGSEREEIETPLSPDFLSPVTYPMGASSDVPFPIPDVDPALTIPANVRGKRLFPRARGTNARNRPPIQTLAVTSSSSGGASSRASSRSRGSGKSQGLQPVARKKNIGISGLTRMGTRPVAKGTENIPILVSDSEDARESEKHLRNAVGSNEEAKTHSDAPSNKKQKISPTSLRKTSSLESRTKPPLGRRQTAPQKPIRIARSTSSGASASSHVGARRKVGFVGSDKPAVRTTGVRGGGAGTANESEG